MEATIGASGNVVTFDDWAISTPWPVSPGFNMAVLFLFLALLGCLAASAAMGAC